MKISLLPLLRARLEVAALLASTWLASAVHAQSWEVPAQSTPLSARKLHASASEPSGRLLVFGGVNSAGTALGDTVRYDGFSWANVSPAITPSPRSRSAMATDPVNGWVVLFGGSNSSGFLGDTWLWHEGVSAWIFIAPPGGPSARAGHVMTFDPTLNQIVLFGGKDSTGLLSDTWAFDAGTFTWTTVSVGTPPAARWAASAEFVPTPQILGTVLVGGEDSSGALGDIWVLRLVTPSSGGWTALAPFNPTTRFPTPNADQGLEFVPGRGLVLTGGRSSNQALDNQQWEWNGTIVGAPSGIIWTLSTLGNAPAAHAGHRLDLGPRGELVSSGGADAAGLRTNSLVAEVMPTVAEAAHAAIHDRSAPGCASAAPIPSLTTDTGPLLGTNFVLDLRKLGATTPAAFVSFGFSQATQSCTTPSFGHVSAQLDLVLLSGGSGQLTLPIPNDLGLAGVRFFQQAIALDPSGSVILSGQIDATLGI